MKTEMQSDIIIAVANYYFKALKKIQYRLNTNFTLK